VYHPLGAPASGISESGARDDAKRAGPAVGDGYYPHRAATGVCLPGGNSGRLFAESDRLGAGAEVGGRTYLARAAPGAGPISYAWVRLLDKRRGC
jgi:hypothetical protein